MRIPRFLLRASFVIFAASWWISPLRAQEPADRDALEAFQDSLLLTTDTVPLVAFERHLIDQAKVERDSALLHIRIGLVNLRIGDLGGKWRYEDAASEFTWVTELQPQWPWGWYGLGLAELGVGEPEIALLAGLQNMFGKDHLTKSALAFAHSAEVDPSFVRGLVELANTALKQKINIKLDMAREALRIAAATAAARNSEVQLYRGRVEREIGDIDTSIVSFRRYLEAPGAHRALGDLELARSLFVKGDLLGNPVYYEGAALDDTLALAEYRKDLAYIATDSVLGEFDRVSGSARAEYLRGFWVEKDHLELRKDGERLREHYRRIHYARRNFGLVSTRRHYDIVERYHSNSQDFDDRGLMYIRHGEPSQRATLHLPGVELNETWKYGRADGDLVFHFVAREDVQDFKLVESVIDVFGFQAAVRMQGGDIGADSAALQQLLESREPIDPLYSRLQGASRGGLSNLISQERHLGQKSIAQGIRTDTYQLEFTEPLKARTDVMAVGRSGPGNLLQVTWAIPGAALKPIPHEQGFVYPVRLRVNVTDANGRSVATLDTTKMFLSRTAVPPQENLVDRVSIPVPAGTLHYRIAVEQQQGSGTIMPTDSIRVGDFTGQNFTVSSVVLGWRNANLRWLPQGGDTVYFNPTGVYRQNAEMQLYYEVYGLTAGTPYQVELQVGKREGGRAAITLKYEERADSVVTRSHRSVLLERVRQGDYIMRLIITTPDGRKEERRAAFQVSKEVETANR